MHSCAFVVGETMGLEITTRGRTRAVIPLAETALLLFHSNFHSGIGPLSKLIGSPHMGAGPSNDLANKQHGGLEPAALVCSAEAQLSRKAQSSSASSKAAHHSFTAVQRVGTKWKLHPFRNRLCWRVSCSKTLAGYPNSLYLCVLCVLYTLNDMQLWRISLKSCSDKSESPG